MNTVDKKPILASIPTKVVVIAGVIVAALVFLYYRINYLSAPVGNDESVYLYLGRLAMQGKIPYIDFYEMKPPMLFYTYGIVGLLSGYSPLGMHIVAILMVIASSILLYFILIRNYAELPTMLACAIWALMYSSPLVYGNYLQSEHFVAMYLIGVFYLLMFRKASIKDHFWAGLLYSAAVLTKQTALFFAIPGLILLYLQEDTWKLRFKKTLYFAIGSLSLGLFFVLLLLALGSFQDAMYWMIEFPRGYASRIDVADGKLNLKMFGGQIIRFNAIFFGLAGVGTLYALVSYKDKINWFYILCILFGFASLFPGMRFYGQYWLLLIFPFVFVFSLLFDKAYKSKWSLPFFVVILALVILQAVTSSNIYFASNVDKQINIISNGQFFDKTKKMAGYLNTIMKKEDSFMVLGAVSQLYLYTNKIAPTRHVWNTMLNVKTSKNREYQEEYLHDLEVKKPDYIFYSFSPLHWNLRSSNSDYVYNKCFEFVSANYQRIAIMDLKTGTLVTGNDARTQQVRPETYVIYKRR